MGLDTTLTRSLTIITDYRATKEAEATFIAKKKEAEGITEMAKAYGQMASVLGGPQGKPELPKHSSSQTDNESRPPSVHDAAG